MAAKVIAGLAENYITLLANRLDAQPMSTGLSAINKLVFC